jgi:putative glycosyltransferase (TIGR04348 family)
VRALVVTPAAVGSRTGNRITALRWSQRLRELGWRVQLEQQWRGEPCDVLIALHARKSHASVARLAEQRPEVPRVVALTGTDLYGDLSEPDTARSLRLASRLVLLQPLGARRLPEAVLARARTIRQSARAPVAPLPLPGGGLPVCVIGHLREVKAPLLAVEAVQRLPASSQVRVLHLGGALDEVWRQRAEQAQASTAGRWTWLGERPRATALRMLMSASALVLTSVSEGGANVVTEAIACGVPVLSTRIEGSLGILGEDHPGYFEPGDAWGLAELLLRCEREPGFLQMLAARSQALRPLVEPARERQAWAELLSELGLESPAWS